MLLGLLKRTCPLLIGVSVRRSLYLSLVKSQLCYATQVWSPAYVILNAKVEQVQRRASGWILRTLRDESSYKERLTLLYLLPLFLDRELKDLIFLVRTITTWTLLDGTLTVTLIPTLRLILALLRQRLYRTSEAPLKLLHLYYNLTIYVLHTNR